MAIQRKSRINRMLSSFLMAIAVFSTAAKSMETTFDCPKLNSTHLCNCKTRSVTCDSFGVTDVNFLEPFAELLQNLSAADNSLCELPMLLVNATNLMTLDLSHNEIDRVDPNILAALSSLVYLDLSYNKLQDFRIAGDVLPGLRFLDLTANVLSNIRFDPRPNNAFKVAILRKNMLSNLTNAFAYNKLCTLFLSHNNIMNNLDFLQNLSNLKNLSLGSNNISEISPTIFTPQHRSLTYLYLDNNRLSNLTFLKKCGFLFKLDLSCNNITEIPQKTFQNLTILDTIHLDNNKIKNSSFVQYITKNLHILDLSHNKISDFDPKHFENKVNLFEIDVSFNELSSIKFSSKVKGLLIFRADHNNISKIEDCTFLVRHSSGSKIKNISLANNRISDIKFLLYLSNISDLNLSNNQLRHIPENMLEHHISLKRLNLSNNEISDASFVRKSRLTHIDLSRNNVQSFPCDTTLQFVNLEGNNVTDFKLGCASHLQGVRVCGGTIREKNDGHLKGSNEIILEIRNKTIYFDGIPSLEDIAQRTNQCNYLESYVLFRQQQSIFSSPMAITIYVICGVLCVLFILCTVIKLFGVFTRVSNKKQKCTCDRGNGVHMHQRLTASFDPKC